MECNTKNITVTFISESLGNRHTISPVGTLNLSEGHFHASSEFPVSLADDPESAPKVSENNVTHADEGSEYYLTSELTSNSQKSDVTENYSAASPKVTPVPQLFENNSTKAPKLTENYSTDFSKSSNSNRSRQMIRDQLLMLSFDLVISAAKTNADAARAILSSVVKRTAGQLYSSSEEFPLYDFKIYDISVQCPAGFTHAKKYHGTCGKEHHMIL